MHPLDLGCTIWIQLVKIDETSAHKYNYSYISALKLQVSNINLVGWFMAQVVILTIEMAC